MRTLLILAALACGGPVTCLAQAGHPSPAAASAGQTPAGSCAALDLRAPMAAMRLKTGRNTIHRNRQGSALQAVVDKQGVITGYLQADADGKVSKVQARSSALRPGQMALVHKCFVITRECLDNPLPRSGNPDDCMLEIPCPNASLSVNLLSR